MGTLYYSQHVNNYNNSGINTGAGQYVFTLIRLYALVFDKANEPEK